MKIGFVLDDSLDHPDGVQQYVLTLGRWYASVGHDVHYLVGQTKRKDIKNIHSLSRNVAVRFNHNRLSIPLPTKRQRLRALLRDEQFDILHVQMPYSPFLAGRIIAAAPDKTAVVGTFHIIPYSNMERIGSRLLGWWLSRSLRRFDQVWSVSKPAQVFAQRSFGISSDILPNVVDCNALRPTSSTKTDANKSLSIVFLGRLVPRKGCRQLLEAARNLQAQPGTPPFQVIIAGDGPLRKSLEAYCVRSDLTQIVTFRGFVSEREKAKLLSEADIAVFPSLGGESFGIVLIEAMAAGAGVVVGGDNPGYRSVLGAWPDCLVVPDDTSGFAAKLSRLLGEPQLRRRLHAAQQMAVAQYAVRVVGERLLAEYQTVVAKRRRT